MNLPNKITLSRTILGPLFLISYFNRLFYLSLFTLLLNLFSDVLDGLLARHRKETTKFGEFIDPSADLLFFLFVGLAFSFKSITQVNWFFIPLTFISLSFILLNLKREMIKIPHTKMKFLHTSCLYFLVFMILFELNFRIFFWVTFTVFILISFELFFRSLKYYLQKQSFTT